MKKITVSAALSLLSFAVAGFAQTRSVVYKTPQNLGSGLGDLVEMHKLRTAVSHELDLLGKALVVDLKTGERSLINSPKHALMVDRQNRVLTTIHLDGSTPIEEIRKSLGDLGISIAAENM